MMILGDDGVYYDEMNEIIDCLCKEVKMKTYRYRLVVKKGLHVGKVVARSNNTSTILKKWKNDNFNRMGDMYTDYSSEIEVYWNSDDTWHGIGNGILGG